MINWYSWKMLTLKGIIVFLLISTPAYSSSGSSNFNGLLSATPTDPDSITLTWNPAQKDQDSTGQITYLIYQAAQRGTHNYDHPRYTTKNTSYRVTGLTSNTTYYFVVWAKDHNATIDSNRVERSAATFGRWIKKKPATSPPSRLAHGMTYDSKSGKVILFGGRNRNSPLNDLWMYDSLKNTWTEQSPATALLPSPRTAINIAYADGRVIAVGGGISITPPRMSKETWIYHLDTNAWTPASTLVNAPGQCCSPNFVYDSANKVVVLFGGGKKIVPGGTWEFDVTQNTWTQISSTISPQKRTHHAMVYNSLDRKVILFGGENKAHSRKLNDTWTYDASTDTWIQVFPTVSPSPRAQFNMVYDSHNHQVILWGGILSKKNQDLTSQTWVYNIAANTWIQVNTPDPPEPRFHHAMAYDPVGKKVILFGGGTKLCQDPHCFATTGFVNDTWVYE